MLDCDPPELFAREKGLRGHVINRLSGCRNLESDSRLIPHQSGGEVAPIECAASERQEMRI